MDRQGEGRGVAGVRPPIRVMLADDDAQFLANLRRVIALNRGLSVTGTAGGGREAVAAAAAQRPDVILMDIEMPDMDGIEATRQVLAAAPGIRVLGLSGHADRRLIAGLVQAGAAGYLLKSVDPLEIFRAIQEVAAGRSYVSAALSDSVIEEFRSGARPDPAGLDRLTNREREVAQLAAAGRSTKEIAAALGLSTRTIEAHLAAARAKLGVHDTAGVAAAMAGSGTLLPTGSRRRWDRSKSISTSKRSTRPPRS